MYNETYRKAYDEKRSGWVKDKYNRKIQKDKLDNKAQFYNFAGIQPQKNFSSSTKPKSSSGFLSINSFISPTHSVFEKKIRQAIQIRYSKSQVKNYKYERTQNSQYENQIKRDQFQHQQRQSSLKSEEMQEMIHFAYLKNVAFVNINHFHSKKDQVKKQVSTEKQKNKKRRFQLPISFSKQKDTKKQLNIPKNQESLRTLQTMNHDQDIANNFHSKKQNKNFQESQTFNCEQNLQRNQIFQDKSKKFLTSRLPSKKLEQNNFQHDKKKNFETLSPRVQYSSRNKIKDTFKLKYPNDIKNKNIQKDRSQQNSMRNEQKYSENSLQKTNKKNRRYLLAKKQKLEYLKTEPEEKSEKSFDMQHFHRKSPYNKITSLRKIQTQFIDPLPNQQQIYNKTTKNKAKMIKNYRNNNLLMNRINESSQKSFHSSTSQQKWKLQEISFKFKPINQLQQQQKSVQTKKMQQNKNHALKLGLSLEKAYTKLLQSKKKVQKKQDISGRNKQLSEQKKKRRLLRVSPKNQNPFRIDTQRQSKLLKKDQPFHISTGTLVQNISKESLNIEISQSKKHNFLKNNKKERFATIQ